MERTTTAERLKQLMEERDLKQNDILALCVPYFSIVNDVISKTNISLYVSGKSKPNQNKLYILARALNVSEAWLMGFDVPRDRPVRPEPEPRVLPLDDLTEAEIKEIIAYKQFIINRRGLV